MEKDFILDTSNTEHNEIEFIDYELEDILGGLFPGSSSYNLGSCCSDGTLTSS